jgi:hypothetical protein
VRSIPTLRQYASSDDSIGGICFAHRCARVKGEENDAIVTGKFDSCFSPNAVNHNKFYQKEEHSAITSNNNIDIFAGVEQGVTSTRSPRIASKAPSSSSLSVKVTRNKRSTP